MMMPGQEMPLQLHSTFIPNTSIGSPVPFVLSAAQALSHFIHRISYRQHALALRLMILTPGQTYWEENCLAFAIIPHSSFHHSHHSTATSSSILTPTPISTLSSLPHQPLFVTYHTHRRPSLSRILSILVHADREVVVTMLFSVDTR